LFQKETFRQLFENEDIKYPDLANNCRYSNAFIINLEKLTQNKITEKINNNGDKKTGNAVSYPVWD